MERFTQRARRVLSLAQEAAERCDSAKIDTEHLMLGLVSEEDGKASAVFKRLHVDQHQVQALLEGHSPSKRKTEAAGLDLSNATKKTLELAVDGARRLGHHYLGTEHLLLGLLRLPDGSALDMLRDLGLNRETIRREISAILAEIGESDVGPAPQTPRPRQANVEYLLLRISSRAGRINHFPIDLSLSAKDALEGALQELGYAPSLLLEDRHILLGFLQNSQGAISLALRDMGVDVEELIRKLRDPSGD